MTIFQNVRKGLIPARLLVEEVYDLQEAGLISDSDSFELVDGEIVPTAAAKFSPHEWRKSRLIEVIVRSQPAETAVFVESSITLNEATFVEPDVAVWPRGLPSREARGADLLLVIEVADSSIAYDLKVNAPLHAAHGVQDYWVVDAVRNTIRVHRAPTDGVYVDVEEYEAHDTVKALLLPGVTIRLDALD